MPIMDVFTFHENRLKNQHITNSDIWVIDETYIANKLVVFIITNVKTTAILGTGIKGVDKCDAREGLNSAEILELYKKTAEDFKVPKAIHADCKNVYFSKEIKEWAEASGIALSSTKGGVFQNQLAESVNSAIKHYFILSVLHSTKNAFKVWRRGWPDRFKKLSRVEKARSADFKKYFYSSDFIQRELNLIPYIYEAIKKFNSSENQNFLNLVKISRQDCEKLNQKVVSLIPQQAKASSSVAPLITKSNVKAFAEVEKVENSVMKNQAIKQDLKKEILDNIIVLNNPVSAIELIEEVTPLLQPDQRMLLTAFFWSHAEQMQQLEKMVEQNTDLLTRLKGLESQNANLLSIVEELKAYKERVERLEQEKEQRRLKRRNAKRRQETKPIFLEHYKNIIETINNSSEKGLWKKRLRVAVCIFLLTGLRVTEVGTIKIIQILDMFKRGYLRSDRLKRGKLGHKLPLTREGHNYIEARGADIMAVIDDLGVVLPKKIDYEDENLNKYFFSADGERPYSRVFFTAKMNALLKSVPELREFGTSLTSHGFRYGYISQFWRKSGDVELVKEAIGHARLETTARYIKPLSFDDLEAKMEKIKPFEV